MKFKNFPIFFVLCLADETCSNADECTANILQRLTALENENAVLKNENEALKNDMREIEKIVMPGKIPASCEEHRNRGETENGIYQIKPTMDIEPFPVTCDFRKWCRKKLWKKIPKKGPF